MINRTLFFVLVLSFSSLYSQEKKWVGNGTYNNPMLLSSVSDLISLSEGTNWGIRYENMYFQLTNDIVFNDGVVDSSIYFHPLNEFSGILNGNGYSIKGLKIDTAGRNIGFISKLRSGMVMKLGFENCYFQAIDSIGCIVGVIDQGSLVENCYVINSQIIGAKNVGALAGANFGNILKSYCVNNTIIGSNNIGGLVGYNNGNLNDVYTRCSFSSGVILGGIIGYNDIEGSISHSYSVPNITSPNPAYQGIIIGKNIKNNCNSRCFGIYDPIIGLIGNGEDTNLIAYNDSIFQSYGFIDSLNFSQSVVPTIGPITINWRYDFKSRLNDGYPILSNQYLIPQFQSLEVINIANSEVVFRWTTIKGSDSIISQGLSYAPYNDRDNVNYVDTNILSNLTSEKYVVRAFIKTDNIYDSIFYSVPYIVYTYVGLTDIEKENICVYPTISSDYINITGLKPNNYAKLIDINGRVIDKRVNNRIDCSNLKPGIYFINYWKQSIKIIVQ